jgi:hypothetical protein
VRLVGEIVRHDGDGLALMWADSDPQAALALADLLNRLQPRDAQAGDHADASANSNAGSNEVDFDVEIE